MSTYFFEGQDLSESEDSLNVSYQISQDESETEYETGSSEDESSTGKIGFYVRAPVRITKIGSQNEVIDSKFFHLNESYDNKHYKHFEPGSNQVRSREYSRAVDEEYSKVFKSERY